jgi:hypothetical protein
VSSDAYIRLGSRGVRAHGQPAHHDSVVFVDAPPRQQLHNLRHAPFALFRDARILLVRAGSPIDSPSEADRRDNAENPLSALARQVKALGLRVKYGVLHQPVGNAAWIEGDVPQMPDVLARARAIELEALLTWGNGVWRPENYHYLLPSGEHAAGFVRVADAIRRPRDAEVLASWLHYRLADNLGIVFDTGTLSAVAQALVAAMRSRGWAPGAVNVLDGYPATAIDVTRAVQETDRGGGVMAVLSVNSSGRVRDRIAAALERLTSQGGGSVDVLVDKRLVDRHEQIYAELPVSTWHPRPGFAPLVDYGSEGSESCHLCRDITTARIVPISPGSFDGMLPSAVAETTPAVSDAGRNFTLWECCNEPRDPSESPIGAIAFDSNPVDAVAPFRPRESMAIVVDHEQLLASRRFHRSAVAALDAELRRCRHRPQRVDLLLIPKHEAQLAGHKDFARGLYKAMGGRPKKTLEFPVHDDWSHELNTAVRDASRTIGVLCLGTVSGSTLQAALAAVQAAREPGEYDLIGYVIHARPLEEGAWRTLRNSYAHQLFAAWHSYLPDRSVFAEEHAVLAGVSHPMERALSTEARALLVRRKRFPTQVTPADEGVFWGTTPDSQLTPNSILGQGLRGPAVLTAVASAMERARKQAREVAAPTRRVFDMPAIARSYYDPMILAAVLRWIEPHEAWWGWRPADEKETIQAMLERATKEQKLILVPELLLAAAQGKLRERGIRVLRAHARLLLDENQVVAASNALTAEQRAPIELGVALCPEFGTRDEEKAAVHGALDAIARADGADELLRLLPDILRDLQQRQLPLDVIKRLDDRVQELLGPRSRSRPASSRRRSKSESVV